MGDDWAMIGSNEYFTKYYNPSSVKIDTHKKTIEVLVKHIYTDKGKIDYIRELDNLDKPNYNDIHHTLVLLLLDYNYWKYISAHITDYSTLGVVLFDEDYPPEWDDIVPDSLEDFMLDKFIHNYSLQR